ncbi:MAG: PP2C family protein-serine/threonine phosphatase [Melioribacteraceae bacterium]|nr:PP2C family protein-serine/threonine phosphatase [Melioribacteraceae bacterium]
MKINAIRNKYWIIAGILIAALTIILYPSTPYNSFDLKVNRSEAIELAKNFLSDQKIDITGYSIEGFFENSPIENKYLLKQLGNKEYKNVLKTKDWAFYGWEIMVHKNLDRNIPQNIYTVSVNQNGKITSFDCHLADTTKIPSINPEEAEKILKNFSISNFKINLDEYSLVETKEEKYVNRVDHKFTWEKKLPEINSVNVITAVIQGDKPGSFENNLRVPDAYRNYFEVGQVVFITASILFVFLWMIKIFWIFIKKYHQGEVWLNLGTTLLLIFIFTSIIVLVNYWPGLGKGLNIGTLNFITTKVIALLLNGVLLYFFLGLLIFASWSVGESFARSLWKEKLSSIDAFTKGKFLTLGAGESLFKGMILGSGLSLLYLIGSILLNKPGTQLFITPINLLSIYSSYLPVIDVILGAFSNTILASVVITFLTINITYPRWQKKWVSIVLTGAVMMLSQSVAETPPSVNLFAIDLLIYFLFGCFTAYIYFKYDLLTVAGMNFYVFIITRVFLLSATTNPFYNYNLYAISVVILAAPAVYIISRFRKEEFVFENYGVPAHIQRISERERLKKEMEIAAKVQLSLLPKEEPLIEGYEFSACSIPAVEAGGDYFDFVKLNSNRLGIAIGDVSGKGVGAAIYMTLTKGILQAHAEENVSPRIVLSKVNRLLYKTIEKNSFVSMFYAILDYKEHTLLYSRAGHNPGILCSTEDGSTKLLMSRGIALGLEEGTKFTNTLNEETISIRLGDFVVLYTDGFTEAMNNTRQMYSEEKLIEFIKKHTHLSTRDMLAMILKDVRKFTEGYPQNDDMTIVILKRV